jgi:hypothetical protein
MSSAVVHPPTQRVVKKKKKKKKRGGGTKYGNKNSAKSVRTRHTPPQSRRISSRTYRLVVSAEVSLHTHVACPIVVGEGGGFTAGEAGVPLEEGTALETGLLNIKLLLFHFCL